MKLLKPLIIFALGTMFGFGVAVIGYGIHSHIDFASKAHHVGDRAAAKLEKVFGTRVSAAKLDHIVPPAPYFPPAAIWTQDVSHAPLDPQSSTIINWLDDAGGWGNGNKMQVDWSIRVLQADASTPKVPFRKGPRFASPDSDNVSTFPLPADGGIEGESGYQCTSHGDCHLIVNDRSQGKLYEAFGANYDNSALTAKSLAVWDLKRVYPPSGRGDQCTSADAAGYPIAPLLFTADELATGSINHAIRFILPNSRIRAKVFEHPATHAGGPQGPVSAPAYGVHFRLKASYDMSKLKPAAQVVARAMQKYGMFLSDSGSIALSAQSDKDTKAKYTDLDFGTHDLWPLKVEDFEVVKGGEMIPLTYNCVRNP